MKRILKYLGILIGVLLGVIIVLAVAIYLMSQSQLNKNYDIQVEVVTVADDTETVARGEYLARNVAGCTQCHGDDLGGDSLVDDFALGRIYAPNLTAGEGGIGAEFTDEDWVRAIRHGVNDEGKGILIMHSQDYYNLTDADLGAIIAYLKTVPPVDRGSPELRPGPVGRVLLVLNGDEFVAAERIDHDAPRPSPVTAGVTAEYGQYLASIACYTCHGENLSGRPFGEPGAPDAANLTPSGVARFYELETFREVLRTGITQSGRELDTDYMPWQVFKGMTDGDIEALWLYLETLPPKEFNEE